VIPWQFHIASDWGTKLQVKSLPRRRVPEPPDGWKPIGAPRFAHRIQAHLLAHQADALSHGPFYAVPDGGVVGGAANNWALLRDRHRLHRFANHVRSSQLFALNLFAGLDDGQRIDLARRAGISNVASTDEIVFEFEDVDDRLREASPQSPHRTQVDVMMRCTNSDGARTLLFIEIKLSEIDFGHCSAYESSGNDRRDVCRSHGAFGSDATACFQLRNHDRGERRTYDQHVEIAAGVSNGCAFRLGVNQPMRNVALGRALLERHPDLTVVITGAPAEAVEAEALCTAHRAVRIIEAAYDSAANGTWTAVR
jgi:hypothetical protein